MDHEHRVEQAENLMEMVDHLQQAILLLLKQNYSDCHARIEMVVGYLPGIKSKIGK